ncbi:14450_t:CDS:1, partial [Racocetra persica]
YSHEMVVNSSNNNDIQIIPEFTQKYTITDLSEKCYKKISKNQLKYGALMGEAKKAIHYALQDEDNKLIQFIKEFNKRKENQHIQACIHNNPITSICNTNGDLIDPEQVLDPLKHQSKGRPLLKQLKSSIEQFKNKSKSKVSNTLNNDKGRKCGLCGKNRHY